MCCGLCRLQGCIQSGVSSREIENNIMLTILCISQCAKTFILCLQGTYISTNPGVQRQGTYMMNHCTKFTIIIIHVRSLEIGMWTVSYTVCWESQ